MTSKRRTTPQPTDTIADSDATLPTPEMGNKPAAGTLADIRQNASARMLTDAHATAHTIADLEAWRNEIDATIAFLKAQRR